MNHHLFTTPWLLATAAAIGMLPTAASAGIPLKLSYNLAAKAKPVSAQANGPALETRALSAAHSRPKANPVKPMLSLSPSGGLSFSLSHRENLLYRPIAHNVFGSQVTGHGIYYTRQASPAVLWFAGMETLDLPLGGQVADDSPRARIGVLFSLR